MINPIGMHPAPELARAAVLRPKFHNRFDTDVQEHRRHRFSRVRECSRNRCDRMHAVGVLFQFRFLL